MLSLLLPSFRPSVVVLCGGVDGLASDRMSPFNLTTRTYARCVHMLKKRLRHFNQIARATTEGASAAPATAAAATADAADAAADAGNSNEAAALIFDPPTIGGAPTINADTSLSVAEPVPAATASSSSASLAAAAPYPPGAVPPALSSAPAAPPVPLLLLGGGGYCPTDAARAFTVMTAAACCHPLPATLPDSDRLLSDYSPNFNLHSLPKSRPNLNDRPYINRIMQHVSNTCRRLREQQEKNEEQEE